MMYMYIYLNDEMLIVGTEKEEHHTGIENMN